MTAAEFGEALPQRIQDVFPQPAPQPAPKGSDPDGRYECINGQMHLCIDDPTGAVAEICIPLGFGC